MEAVVVAASKQIALSASVAAAAAEEEAAAAAATDKEAAATALAAALTAREAVAATAKARQAASAAAFSAKEKASVAATARQVAAAAALDAKEVEDVLATATAATQASKKRKIRLIDDGGSVDLTSRLRDDELRIIVSLLSSKEGVRTQVISRRWRPIWHSAPLKQLTLESVTISEDALQSMLSAFSAFESLELKNNFGFSRLCISSQTLKSIGFCTTSRKDSVLLQELLIVDTPCLERFLILHPTFFSPTIRIISAPKLKILGMLSRSIPEFHFGTTIFKEMHAVSLTTKMHTIRVLVLDSCGPNLVSVVNFLKCFPCLESLYVIIHSGAFMDNVRKYDPLDPIECLELHLKKVVLKNYDGTRSESIQFTKFLVLNAKVLKEMKISLPYHRKDGWFANQRSLLQIRNRASKDAQIELKCGITDNFKYNRNTHDLSMADPFDIPSKGCFCGQF